MPNDDFFGAGICALMEHPLRRTLRGHCCYPALPITSVGNFRELLRSEILLKGATQRMPGREIQPTKK